jgi:hypothetical protein
LTYFSNGEIWLTRKPRKTYIYFSHFENLFSQLSLNLAKKEKRLDRPSGWSDFAWPWQAQDEQHKMGICSSFLNFFIFFMKGRYVCSVHMWVNLNHTTECKILKNIVGCRTHIL